jgi:hypothetical protein
VTAEATEAAAPPPPPPVSRQAVTEPPYIPGLDLSNPADRKDWERFLLYIDEGSKRAAARRAECSRSALQRSVRRVTWLLKRSTFAQNDTTGQHAPS